MVLALAGCSKPSAESTNTPTGASSTPFLDQTKTVQPGQEWNREVVSRRSGPIRYRVDTPGAYALSIITDKGYKAIQSGNRAAFSKSDVLLTIDKTGAYEATISLEPGSSWFMIMNATDKPVNIHLSCWDAP